jgi:hypothetical protein
MQQAQHVHLHRAAFAAQRAHAQRIACQHVKGAHHPTFAGQPLLHCQDHDTILGITSCKPMKLVLPVSSARDTLYAARCSYSDDDAEARQFELEKT